MVPQYARNNNLRGWLPWWTRWASDSLRACGPAQCRRRARWRTRKWLPPPCGHLCRPALLSPWRYALCPPAGLSSPSCTGNPNVANLISTPKKSKPENLSTPTNSFFTSAEKYIKYLLELRHKIDVPMQPTRFWAIWIPCLSTWNASSRPRNPRLRQKITHGQIHQQSTINPHQTKFRIPAAPTIMVG